MTITRRNLLRAATLAALLAGQSTVRAAGEKETVLLRIEGMT